MYLTKYRYIRQLFSLNDFSLLIHICLEEAKLEQIKIFHYLPWETFYSLFFAFAFSDTYILSNHVSTCLYQLMVFIIFTATLSDLLEQLMDIRADTTGPERLVREAAQGHADAVKDIVTKHPDKVSSASHFKLCICKL